MPINTDTGHDKNVLNLEVLANECDLIKDKYKPSNADLLIPSLLQLHSTTDANLIALAQAVKHTKRATNERELAYATLNPLVTRIVNSLKSTKVPKNTVDDVKVHADKVRGHQSKGGRTKKKEGMEGAEEVKSISTAELSFDNKLKNFVLLIDTLESEPAYAPNEEELTIASLKTFAKLLKDLNTTVTKAEGSESQARNERNKLLYAREIGLVEIGNKAKNYVLSLFSATSPEYKRISKIKFLNLG